MKEHLAPALYLPFQLDLKGVPLAQKEAIDLLLGGFFARRRSGLARNVGYLAAIALPYFVPFFVLSQEKRLLSLCSLHPVSPVLRGRALRKRRLEEASTHMTPTDIKRPQAIAYFL
jgi:hypothetical protein